ncbi:hypothetical protein ACFVWG_40355 [Kribbella sp. NPDC058245]|uniref:hypothetical protein n=1 Tax=Kribbella sp. NPDC058245 TaxID=3346399 RepID=UPI0036E9A463
MRKHLLFVATAASGHINPTLPLVEALVRRGHRVSYPVPEAFADQVRRAGADVVPAPSPNFGSGGPGGGPLEFTAELVGRMAGGFMDGLGAKIEPLVARFADAPPDAVCYTSMAIEGPAVADILGVPAIQLFPSYASNERYAVRDEFLPTEAEPARRRTGGD